MLDNLAKNISILTIATLLLGFAYQNAYYSSFGINILTYTTNLELLYSLLPFAFYIFSIGFLVLQVHVAPVISKPIFVNADSKRNGFKKRIILLVALIILLEAGGHLYWKFAEYRYYRYYVLINTIVSLIVISQIYTGRFIKKLTDYSTVDVVVIFVAVAYMIIQFSSATAKEIKMLGKNEKYELVAHGRVTTTSKTYYLVGETQSHLFFYNKYDSTTTIVKRSDIDTLRVRGIY
jgi:hypothetical protein